MTVTAGSSTLPVATLPVVRAYVQQLQRKGKTSRIIGIRAQPTWNGPDRITVGDATVRIKPCVSALAVREAFVEHAQHDDDYLVIITDVDDLGHGILSRLATGRLQAVQLWQAVKESFSANEIDPLLVGDKDWAPRALVDHEPASGWPPAPSGTLTRDFALGHLASVLFGAGADSRPHLDPEHPDAEGLLRWSSDAVALKRWLDLPANLREGLGQWLGSRTGAAGQCTLRAVSTGNGPDAVALGLVAGLLWHTQASERDVAMPRAQFLTRLSKNHLDQDDAQAWSRAVTSYVSRGLVVSDPSAISAIHRAEALLKELRATHLVPLSDQLEGAFDFRLRHFAGAVREAAKSVRPAALAPVEGTHSLLHQHDLAARDRRAEVATMALRLLRWLAAVPADPTADDVKTLADALDRQVRIDAWVDRALAPVWVGDLDPEVGSAYRALAELVIKRRARHDEQLARLVAQATDDHADLGKIMPVEQVIPKVVRPLADKQPVLLIVVDGLSTGVMTELTEGFRTRRWVELVARHMGRRQAALPVLPTVTQVSRTSLLTAKLQTGSQRTEQADFAAAVGYPSSIFHKKDLRSPAGDAIAPDLRLAIQDTDIRVVAVVLNTVDDSLDKMDPGGTLWGVDMIQHLGPLLDVARQADRVVILTSDHGYVIDRDSESRPVSGGGARWRPATSGPPNDGEIAISGKRVLLGDGSVVLPWRENLRYTAKGAGYHGGASAAEISVPLTVHVAGAVDELAGWVPAPPPEPVWWHSPLAPPRPTVVEAAPMVPATAGTLFDEPEPAKTVAGDAVDALLDALFASEVYATQRSRGGRTAPHDARVRAIVEALLRNDGRLHETTLAAATNIPASRVKTTIAAVRRLLAVDGFESLKIDPDGVTLVLDLPTLREQFGLRST